jgi:hypothetical protein
MPEPPEQQQTTEYQAPGREPRRDDPNALAYRNPRDEPQEHPLIVAIQSLLGFVVAGCIFTFLSAIPFLVLNPLELDVPAHRRGIAGHFFFIPTVIFAIIACASIVHFRRNLRRAPQRWFVLGAALGIGLVALLEGACFAMQP